MVIVPGISKALARAMGSTTPFVLAATSRRFRQRCSRSEHLSCHHVMDSRGLVAHVHGTKVSLPFWPTAKFSIELAFGEWF